MPSPATANITIGSILELLAPTSLPVKDGSDQAAFDSLLQPPAPPTPPSCSSRKDEAPSPSTARREGQTSKAPDGPGRSEQAAAPAPGSAAPVEPVKGDVENQAPGDNDAPQEDDASTGEITERCDEKVVAESLAALSLVPTAATLPDIADGDEPRAEAAPSEIIAPAAAQRSATKAAALKAGHSAAEKVVTDKPNAAQPLKAQDAEQGAEQAVRRAAARRTDGVRVKSEAETKDFERVQANGAAPTNGNVGADKPVTSLGELAQLKVEAVAAESAPGDDRHASAQERESSAVTVESLADPAQAPDQNPVTNRPAAAVAAVPVPVPTAPATHQTTTSSSGSAGSTSSSQAIGGRTRAPLASLSEGAGDVRRSSRVEIDTTRLLSRVTRAFQAAQQRDGELRLRLSPPELGSLRLLVHVQDGVLVAKLETETTAAKTAILDNLPALKERLAEQGVRIERFDVDLMQQQSGGMPDRPQDQERNVPPPTRPAAVHRPRGEPSPAPRAPVTAIDPTGRLNVII